LVFSLFIILGFFWAEGQLKLLKRNRFNFLVIKFACILIKSEPLGVCQQLFVLWVALIETNVNQTQIFSNYIVSLFGKFAVHFRKKLRFKGAEIFHQYLV
jgi:hypothetical protein